MKMHETLIETFSFIADNNPNTKDGGRSFRDAVTGGNVLDPPPSPIDEKQFPPLMDMNKHLGKPLPQRRVSHQSQDQGMSQEWSLKSEKESSLRDPNMPNVVKKSIFPPPLVKMDVVDMDIVFNPTNTFSGEPDNSPNSGAKMRVGRQSPRRGNPYTIPPKPSQPSTSTSFASGGFGLRTNKEDQKTFIVIDTNIWLNEGPAITRLVDEQGDRYTVHIPIRVSSEIDGLKNNENEDTAKKARRAMNQMNLLLTKWDSNRIIRQDRDEFAEASLLFDHMNNPDLQIKQAAVLLQKQGQNVKIFTRDRGMINECLTKPKVDIYHPEGEAEFEMNVKISKFLCLITYF